MIFEMLFKPKNVAQPAPAVVPAIYQERVSSWGTQTKSGQRVSADSARSLSTAYRCGNIISDDIAAMPLQEFQKVGRSIFQVAPDPVTRNLAYLLEIQPNRWMTPFIFKKTAVDWLIFWGNAYIWTPPGAYREMYLLGADVTYPVFDADGSLWFKSRFPDGQERAIPAVEICHLMINPVKGLIGRSVITFAKETMGRQMGAHETQDEINGNGLKPGAVMWVNGEANLEARDKLRRSYTEAIEAGGVAVFDNKITKFEPVTMKPSDAQFLESIGATDAEIANFFGVPLYKLNMGKQSYQSNEQQNLDYLRTSLNPYLVQFEQAGRLKWMRTEEQVTTYLRFIRESLLQTDAKTRAEYLEKLIFSGQLTPNEARQINDQSAYEGGDKHYVPANMVTVEAGTTKDTKDTKLGG